MTSTAVDPEEDLASLLFEDSPEATRRFIETYFTITNEAGQVVKMKLYPQQVKMLQDATGRDITVKGRQTRATSLKVAARVRRAAFQLQEGSRILLGAQDDATTNLMRVQVRHHLQDLNKGGFDVKCLIDNADELVLGNGVRFQFISGEQRVMGRAYAAQEVHLSELSHWKESTVKGLLGGLLPSVPGAPRGRIDFESTPAGEVGAFHDYAMDARPFDPFNEWTVHFYGWWLEPRYRVSDNPSDGYDRLLSTELYNELKTNFTPTEEELALIQEYGLDTNQVLWRRLRKQAQDKTDAPFAQEYPEDILKCWLGVSGRFFDTADGIDHLGYYRQDERKPLKYIEKLSYKGDEIGFFGPNLAIWELPIVGDAYVVAFDAASGGIGSRYDYTSIGVWNASKGKRVARCLVQCTPRQAGAMVCAIGSFYGTAMAGGERSHHGNEVFNEMKSLGYENIYYHVDPKKHVSMDSIPQPGIYPTPEMRQRMLEEFKAGITNHEIHHYDSILNQQMSMFTWEKFKDKLKAMAVRKVGSHDDVVMEAANGWFLCEIARNRRQVVRRRMEMNRVIGKGGLVVEHTRTSTTFPW